RSAAVPSQEDWPARRVHQVHTRHQCHGFAARNLEFVFRGSVQMVQFLLSGRRTRLLRTCLIVAAFLALSVSAGAGKQRKATTLQPAPPELLLDGGRKLTFERSFSLEREVKPNRSFWTRVVD